MKLAFLALTMTLIVVVGALGRRTERVTAAVLVAASLVSPLVERTGFVGVEVGITAIDVAVLIVLVRIAVVGDRFWPIWAAGFQLAGVAVDLARMAKPDVWFFAYSNAEIFWAYPVYLALIVGTLLEARHRSR